MLEAKVVVEVAGEMFLYAERSRLPASRRSMPRVAGRFGRLREVSLASVVFEWTQMTPPMSFLTAGLATAATKPDTTARMATFV